jgi:hypothetical protein
MKKFFDGWLESMLVGSLVLVGIVSVVAIVMHPRVFLVFGGLSGLCLGLGWITIKILTYFQRGNNDRSNTIN